MFFHSLTAVIAPITNISESMEASEFRHAVSIGTILPRLSITPIIAAEFTSRLINDRKYAGNMDISRSNDEKSPLRACFARVTPHFPHTFI